ncbi:MAG: tetratricopeptide repeat protein [Steroidobacteraceae bacterium]
MPVRRAHPEAFVPLYGFSIVSLLIQVGLIVHAVKTGRSWLWVAAIGFLPGVGTLAYIAVELLPELLGGRTARRAKVGVQRIIDPDRDLRRASAEVEISGNVDARRRLADELIDRGQYDRAIEVYGGGLTGIFEHDPTLLLGIARAQFAKQDYAAARTTLQRLAEHNREFKSADCRLLYARTLEAVGALEESEREYAAVAPVFPGAEARLRYGLLLKRRGKIEESRRVLKDLLESAEIGPNHYRKAQAEWLQLARREIA